MTDFAPPEGDPATLRAAAGNFRTIAGHLAQQTTTMRSQAQTAVDASEWKGGYALRFRAGADGVVAQAADMGTTLGSLAEVVSKLAVDLQAAIEEVAQCKEMAEHAEAEARHSVSRLDPASPTYDTARGAAEFQASVTYINYLGRADKAKARYQRLAQAAAGRIDALTDRAVPGGSNMTSAQIVAAIDGSTGMASLNGSASLTADQAWAALEQWTDPDTSTNVMKSLGLSLVAAMPPADAARWWNTLTPLQQMQAIRVDPDLGNVDGVAFWARDLANRSQINVYRDQLEAQLAELQAAAARDKVPYDPYSGRAMHDGSSKLKEIAEIKEKLDSLSMVEHLARQPDHHILGLDFSHERAQAIVGQGDLDTAKYAGVFTPGLTSTVNGRGMQHTDDDLGALRQSGVDDLMSKMSQQQIEALGGFDAAKKHAQNQVAMVTWLDYQAPQISGHSLLSANSVASSHTAKEAGDHLANFYRGLDQSRAHETHGNPQVLGMAHSYGTPVLGYAAQHTGTGIDRMWAVESPGMGANHASDFHVPAGQVYVSEGDNDPVADAAQFHRDPSRMPGVEHLETRTSIDPVSREPLGGSTWHPFHDYIKDGTTTHANGARLLVGQTGDLIRGNDTDYGDALRPLTYAIPATTELSGILKVLGE